MNKQFIFEVASKDKFSKPLNSAAQVTQSFKSEMVAARAEVKKLSLAQRDIQGYQATKEGIKTTSKELSGYRKAMTEAGKKLGEFTAKQKQLSAQKTKVIKELAIAEKAGSKTAIKSAKDKIKAIEKEERAVTRSAKQQQKVHDNNSKKVAGTTKRYEQQRRKLNALHQEISKAGLSTNNFSDSQRRLQLRTEKANKAFQAQQARLKKIGQLEKDLGEKRERRNELLGKGAATLAELYAVNRLVNTSADFQSAMIEVEKKANFQSKTGVSLSEPQQARLMSALERQILRDAPSLGLDPKQIAQIVATGAGSDIARSGHELEDLRRFTTLAAKMANAFDGMSPDEAGKSVATWKAALGLTIEELEMMAGAINHFSDNTSANTTAVTKVLTNAGAILKSTGLDTTQSTAMAAAILAANGNQAEMGRTAAKNLALSLTMGESSTAKQKAAFQSLGLDAVQISKDIQKDSVGTIIKIFESISNNVSGDRKTAVIFDLFGSESIDPITSLISNIDKMKEVFEITNQKAEMKNSLDREFAKITETYNFQKIKLRSSLTVLTSVVGEHLLPAFTLVVSGLTSATGAISEFMMNNEGLTSVLVKGAAVVAALKAAQIAYKIGAVSLDIMLGKRRISETKLGASVSGTSKAALFASRAIDRLNASLMMTGGKGRRAGSASVGAAAASKGGRFKGMMGAIKSSKVPIAAQVATAGLVASTLMSGESATMGQDIGGLGGSMAGAAAGAALGSVIPIVGTLAGGIIGAIAGEELGSWLGGMFDKKPEDIVEDVTPTKPTQSIKEPKVIRYSINNLTEDQVASLNSSQLGSFDTSNFQNKKVEVKLENKPQIVIHNSNDEAATRKSVEKAIEENSQTLVASFEKMLNENMGMGNIQFSLSDGIPEEVHA